MKAPKSGSMFVHHLEAEGLHLKHEELHLRLIVALEPRGVDVQHEALGDTGLGEQGLRLDYGVAVVVPVLCELCGVKAQAEPCWPEIGPAHSPSPANATAMWSSRFMPRLMARRTRTSCITGSLKLK